MDSGFLSRRTLVIAATICIAAVFIVFGRSIGYGFLMFDDPYLVVNNLTAHGPTLVHLKAAFTSYDPELYIPLTLVSYQLNWLVSGLHPELYHVTNLILHGLNAFLFGLIVLLLIRRKGIALLFALIYAVHPQNTETAVWIAARKDTLSTLFLFGSIVQYLRYRDTNVTKHARLSIVLYVLAALSKASVFMLPVLLPFLDILRDGKIPERKAALRRSWPYFIVAILTAAVALYGKSRVVESSSMFATILMAAKSTVFYLQKLILPLNLTAIYPYTKPITATSPDFWVPALVLTGLGLASTAAIRKTRWPAVTLALFILTLAPSYFNFHKGVGIFFAVDRYVYVAMIWPLLLLAKATDEILHRRPALKRPATAIGILGLIAAGTLSTVQASYWRNDETVFSRALAAYPESVTARVSLSVWYRESGRINDEERVLREGLPYKRDTALLLGVGSVEARKGNVNEAEKLYREAMTADPENPEPHFYVGSLEEGKGNIQIAEAEYAKAIAMDESYVAAYNNLGAIYLDQNNFAEAEALFRKAITWNPNFLEGEMNLFQALEGLKRVDEAFPHLEKAYALDPENPDILLDYGYRLNTRGQKKKAVAILRHLMDIDPQNHAAERVLRSFDPTWKPRVQRPSEYDATPL